MRGIADNAYCAGPEDASRAAWDAPARLRSGRPTGRGVTERFVVLAAESDTWRSLRTPSPLCPLSGRSCTTVHVARRHWMGPARDLPVGPDCAPPLFARLPLCVDLLRGNEGLPRRAGKPCTPALALSDGTLPYRCASTPRAFILRLTTAPPRCPPTRIEYAFSAQRSTWRASTTRASACVCRLSTRTRCCVASNS